MPHTQTDDEQAIVLFADDGTKYHIPLADMARYEVDRVDPTEIPIIEASEDVTPLVAAQVSSGMAEFYYYGAT